MLEEERKRLAFMSRLEKQLYQKGFKCIAGVDEAGRGPLAGPVIAAACILPEKFILNHLNDSKLVTPTLRRHLFEKIVSNPNVIYGVGIVEADVIDEINILQATLQAMQKALFALRITPDYILFDGKQIPFIENIPHKGVIHGDQLSISIAAASIVAKETRDRIMEKYDEIYPEYGFKNHKGYGTRKHMDAIILNGPSPIHRKTFEPVKICLDEALTMPIESEMAEISSEDSY